MRYWVLCFALCLGLAWTTPDAGSHPQDYFQAPVDFPIRLSGTFGELRPGHFHSGMDIKPSTTGAGDPVLAAADGHIVRIAVTSGGYGNALYIQHNNGYQTVYAHMQGFIPTIAGYVLKEQYRLHSFEVNLYPSASLFPVKQGEPIGILGNSGSSTAPHLHFEIRSSSAEPINPANFGIPVDDRTKPRAYQLVLYTMNGTEPFLVRKIPVVNNRLPDTLDWDFSDLAFGIEAFDLANGATNKNGIYSMQVIADSVTRFKMQLDQFAFAETRYLNAHKDYGEWFTHGKTIHRLHRLKYDRFSEASKTDGWISVKPNDRIPVIISIADAFHNRMELKTVIRTTQLKVKIPDQDPDIQFIYRDREMTWQKDDIWVKLPSHLLYAETPVRYTVLTDHSSGIFSRIHDFHDPGEPVHRYYSIGIVPSDKMAESLKEKSVLLYCDEEGIEVSMGGHWEGDKLEAQVRDFGQFFIGLDTVAPIIEPVEFPAIWKKDKSLKFRISDNYVTSGQAQGLSYTATIDGLWYLASYDLKKDQVEVGYTKPLSSGKHVFRLVVEDDRKNQSVFERQLVIP